MQRYCYLQVKPGKTVLGTSLKKKKEMERDGPGKLGTSFERTLLCLCFVFVENSLLAAGTNLLCVIPLYLSPPPLHFTAGKLRDHRWRGARELSAVGEQYVQVASPFRTFR